MLESGIERCALRCASTAELMTYKLLDLISSMRHEKAIQQPCMLVGRCGWVGRHIGSRCSCTRWAADSNKGLPNAILRCEAGSATINKQALVQCKLPERLLLGSQHSSNPWLPWCAVHSDSGQ